MTDSTTSSPPLLKLKLTPEEVRVLNAVVEHSMGTLKGHSTTAAKGVIYAHISEYIDLRDKIAALNHERETGMARPHSDKVFVHAGLRPDSHDALYTHLRTIGGGSIKPGAIGDWLSDAIDEKLKRDVTATTIALVEAYSI